MKKYFILVFGLLHLSTCHAQNDTLSNTIGKKRFNAFVPASLILAGAISEINFRESLDFELYKERNTEIPHFKTKLDDYLQYSPIVLAYAFDAFGMRSKTGIGDRSLILLKSEVLMATAVTLLKTGISEMRPDRSANNSVPSGHTAQAFVAATFLSEEYGQRYRWVPFLSYSIASLVGGLRMANNKHYLSDVLIGAGIGILSAKIVYRTHKSKTAKRKNNHW